MIYPQNYEQKIAFDNIRQLLAARCLSPLGTEKVEEMAFSAEPEAIRTLLHQTAEMTQVLRDADAFPSDNFFDVREALKKIRVDGTYLLENELFDIKRSLDTINTIVKFFATPLPPEGGRGGYFPHLQALAADVPVFPDLCRQIERILDPFGHVKDSASPELAEIRRQLAQTANSISKTLNSILRSAQAEGLVEKDVAPTMRDGRLVIPISPAFKRKLRGIVHDESATGKTVFIEPAEVVEANNKIRELESEERREIIRLLTLFTDKIRPLTPEIRESYQFLAQIDFIRAKALFALSIDATLPTVENQPLIDWIHAIHPLLLLSHRKQKKPVVPLDLELGKGYKVEGDRLLIISGPNAGGKSVLLKTVGLLQYMLQSGLLIPVDERSKVGIFKDIFLDIGDEQSIENDLSTYSSHLTNMKAMVKNVSAHSLLLIDEFGGGTEPQIGGAIAEALLHRFNDKGSFGIITTHYQNLKSFAENHAGVVNGAMLYDRHEMQPLFRLSIGNPGSSFAIEIARKIGLPEDVIAEASDIVGQDYVAMDKYLQDIVRDKRYWENKRQKIHQQEKHLEELTERYTAKFDKVETQRKEIIAQAQAEAEKLLAEANATIEKTIREIKEAQAEKERTKAARQNLNEVRLKVKGEGLKVEGERLKVKGERPSTFHPSPSTLYPPPSTLYPSPIAVGDTVRIRGQQTAGEVLEIQGKNAVVAFGALKTTSKISQLEKTSRSRLKKESSRPQIILANSADTLSAKKQNFSMELDLRGMRADEALQALMYYLDDAIQCNAGRVRILHGTGTGALRQITRDYLHTAAGVANYQDEHVQLGGAGVTVVELA
ncbi:endonuclease MutS2 [Bacteroidia bacterium]|nr:endonuclease MutS2 [Bacteroidia bacterium]